jgi:hypothetical protein
VLLRSEDNNYAEILAWPVPDIDLEVHDPPTLLATMLPPRSALYFASDVWPSSNARLELVDTTMPGLPLDGLVMAVAQDLDGHNGDPRDLPTLQF